MKPYFSMNMDGLPEMDRLVRLCSYGQDRMWLELCNWQSLVNPSNKAARGTVTVYIGAVCEGGNWRPIQAKDAIEMGSCPIYFRDYKQAFDFQHAIFARYGEIFRRLFARPVLPTPPPGGARPPLPPPGVKQPTSAAFVLAALEVGAMAAPSAVPASLRNATTATCQQLFDELLAKHKAPPPPIFTIKHFVACSPNLAHVGDGTTQQMAYAEQDKRTIRPIVSVVKPEGGVFQSRRELSNLPDAFKRGVFYGFRGDSRKPLDVLDAGFEPNITRKEHRDKALALITGNHPPDERPFSNQIELILPPVPPPLPSRKGQPPPLPPRRKDVPPPDPTAWRHKNRNDLGRFLYDGDLGEFISFTKSVAIAKTFATSAKVTGGSIPQRRAKSGWVYVCYLPGAIEIPPKRDQGYKCQDLKTKYYPQPEQELTWTGAVEWKNVVACREVERTEEFTGPVFVNTKWLKKDRTALIMICNLLSGMSQGIMPAPNHS